MRELNSLELELVSGSLSCMGAFSGGGAILGGAIGGYIGAQGSFGLATWSGITTGSAIGGSLGSIAGAYFC